MYTAASESSKADPVSASSQEFAADVRDGLCRGGQKELPSRYLYDALGTALFEAITLLPEYGLTRADERLLRNHAHELPEHLGTSVFVAELGSGDGHKTRHVLRAFASDQPLVRYMPIDVSAEALSTCSKAVEDIADVETLCASYLDGMAQVIESRRDGERLLVLFLGSTLGNFAPAESVAFLNHLRALLRSGDALLLGTDLMKPIDKVREAYDDPTGVTAAFNLNVLGRMNRELGANFDLRAFRHEARYDVAEQRIEMHLRSLVAQTVEIPGAYCTAVFQADETIWTESSYKFDPVCLPSLASETGFRVAACWIDRDWPFAESLWIAA